MIRVISTSANIVNQYNQRKKQYLHGVSSIVHHYGINPYIIETVKQTDYLSEHYLGNSCYSNNKGINELINIENFFKEFDHKFSDDDDVIKTTLRYEVNSSYLVDFIQTHQYEIYCKYSSDIYGDHDTNVHTFLFSMKYRCWKEFLNTFDRSVNKDHPIEAQLASYATTKNTKYLDKLGILARPASLSTVFII